MSFVIDSADGLSFANDEVYVETLLRYAIEDFFQGGESELGSQQVLEKSAREGLAREIRGMLERVDSRIQLGEVNVHYEQEVRGTAFRSVSVEFSLKGSTQDRRFQKRIRQ